MIKNTPERPEVLDNSNSFRIARRSYGLQQALSPNRKEFVRQFPNLTVRKFGFLSLALISKQETAEAFMSSDWLRKIGREAFQKMVMGASPPTSTRGIKRNVDRVDYIVDTDGTQRLSVVLDDSDGALEAEAEFYRETIAQTANIPILDRKEPFSSDIALANSKAHKVTQVPQEAKAFIEGLIPDRLTLGSVISIPRLQ